jgi:subtilisin family serine protease
MDPALWELLKTGDTQGSEQVEAIIRLDQPHSRIAGVRIVSRFGPIATCRLKRNAIIQIREEESVLSLKAPRVLGPEVEMEDQHSARALPLGPVDGDIRRPQDLLPTGVGVVVGILDWGCDFDYPGFKHQDGSTRLLALWDQRGGLSPAAPGLYGYGTVYSRMQINQALSSGDPYAALGYYPADADPGDFGSHGAHVMDIAAGNGRGGGPVGVAPQADLLFVHLGDSVRILEALDFVARTAGQRPWVVNLSVGRHGGPHDGSTLAELAFDYALRRAPNCFMVQSTGNYYDKNIHASGRLLPGQTRSLHLMVDQADLTPNELEVWYGGTDEFAVRIESPLGTRSSWVRLGEQADFMERGRIVGRLYNRADDPNNADNHIDIFLYPGAPAGSWRVTLRAERVADGSFHAWLERDDACFECQTRFPASDSDHWYTTGTLANSQVPLVVGAFNAHSPSREAAPFSSVGPTRDNRPKPDLVAPGVGVLAARSAPRGWRRNPGSLIRKSGTSMAAPHVTGAVALCLQAARRPLWSHEIRSLILDTAEPADAPVGEALRYGHGYLDIDKAVQAVSNLHLTAKPPSAPAAFLAGAEVNPIEEASVTRNLILLSGGPGLYEPRDPEDHDKSWANYVTPPLVQTLTKERQNSFKEKDEEVWWFIYRPAYERRWADDKKRRDRRPETKRVEGLDCGGQKCRSYVDLLEFRARERDWNLVWINSAADFWKKLTTFNDPISRLLYWGHGRDDLWLSLRHDSSHEAIRPEEHEVILWTDISKHKALQSRFQAGSPDRRHIFYGCNTHTFAEEWAKVFNVSARGFEGTITFTSLSQTGHPKPTASCVLRDYGPAPASGAARESAERQPFLGSLEQVIAGSDFRPILDRNLLAAILGAGSDPGSLDRVDSDMIYRQILFRRDERLAEILGEHFAILARPGEVMTSSPQAGDVLIRSALGEPGLGHVAVIADSNLWSHERLVSAPFQSESRQPGLYAMVIEGGAFPHTLLNPFARRILDAGGRLPPGQILLRVQLPERDENDSETEFAAEQAPVTNWCRIRRLISCIAQVQEARWTLPNGKKRREDEAAMRPLLEAYWRAVPGIDPVVLALKSAKDEEAWSAAFICYVMHAAGVQAAHGFAFGRRHMIYVVGALRNRERSDRDRPFWLYDQVEAAQEATPQIGDLLCFNREDENGVLSHHSYSSLRNQWWVNNQNAEPTGVSHCSLVVDIVTRGQRRYLQTVGGNESIPGAGDRGLTVKLKEIGINQSGAVSNPNALHMFGVIKLLGCSDFV